jgi:hypothetical protein
MGGMDFVVVDGEKINVSSGSLILVSAESMTWTFGHLV